MTRDETGDSNKSNDVLACGFALFCAILPTISALAINVKEWTNTTERLPATVKIHAVQLNQSEFDYGIDDAHAEETKARYKFPYGDFKNIHRCALLAAKSRPGRYKHYNIENAALELSDVIDASNRVDKKP